MKTWPVVPICKAQQKDVRDSDILNNGLYRHCNVYRGGGGYDQFPIIYKKRYGKLPAGIHDQFVVQLKGCPLRCPYCYVTYTGIWGPHADVRTDKLLYDFYDSCCGTFHLMGGAPALHIEDWHLIYNNVNIFHSDFLLIESEYDHEVLLDIPGLHAVSIKSKSFYTPEQLERLWRNLWRLNRASVNYYITFTGDPEGMDTEIVKRFPAHVLRDSFNIPIVEYEANK